MPHLGLETSLLVGAAALLASTLAAITGLGGAAVLLPVLVVAFGVHDAVPILTVRTPLRAFVLIGAGASFLSALLGSVGPLMAPFFLAYGLVKGAYIGTEALSTVVMHVTKLVAYRGAEVLPMKSVVTGLAIGPFMIIGSRIGKRAIDRLPEQVFVLLNELTITAAGLLFLIRGR